MYLDLGGNRFETSVTWFARMYPLDFTEVHVFEVEPNFFVVPKPMTPQQEAVRGRDGSHLRRLSSPYPSHQGCTSKVYHESLPPSYAQAAT